MDIKKNSQKAFIFIINLLVVFLVVCGIKESNKDKFAVENETLETTVPVDDSVIKLQSDIATDRENKLRDLNNAPKVVVQSNEARTTTTTQSKTTSSTTTTKKAPSKKTKTS